MVLVHRLVCETVHGDAPPNTAAAHSCGVPSCINPRHISWKTPHENAEDKKQHGTYLHGESATNAKLTARDVAEIRSIVGIKQSVIAEFYAISQSTVSSIRRRETWVHY
jgi:hypothetical protein